MEYETKVIARSGFPHDGRLRLPGPGRYDCRCRELIHNHGNIFVKRGEWVHDKSRDAKRSKQSSPRWLACKLTTRSLTIAIRA